ncbi:bifunctional adenosylcobinamide kinase/adenosylcobinamide-phosphate guanylyltransferase [Bacillus sp. CGMCC 1.16607]|uniref:bifunctional adenosylcobinamide kinase/adenosylcobinamide-phosphate guanylyltransferase n=1 Tax=Bacillus sp. CGMCC 1.16607 TaxID=3351842 RepID=UPI00362604F2
MQLVVGGAFSGKRRLIRDRYDHLIWHSAYQQAELVHWQEKVFDKMVLVIEGWELWIKEMWFQVGEIDTVRAYFEAEIRKICKVERQHEYQVIFVMLEMGRGIVPMEKNDRVWRDLCGWILQYAAQQAEKVDYCWHGLAKSLK